MAMLCVEAVWPMAILCSRNVNCVCSAFLLHVLYLERDETEGRLLLVPFRLGGLCTCTSQLRTLPANTKLPHI
jgi:hypothetical protein